MENSLTFGNYMYADFPTILNSVKILMKITYFSEISATFCISYSLHHYCIITFMFCDFLSVIRHKTSFDVLCKIRCPKQELHPSSCVFCVQPAGRCKHRAVIITCRKARLFWIGYPLDRANRKILQKIVGHPLLHFEVWELSLG